MSPELPPVQYPDQVQQPTVTRSGSNHTQEPAIQTSESVEAESEHGRSGDGAHNSNQERLSLSNDAELVEGSSDTAGDEVPTDTCKVATRRNSNNTVITILTDCAVILLPLSCIVFTIVIWKLDSTQVGDSLSAWRNVINVVSVISSTIRLQ